MISENEAIALLRKHNVPENIINHSKAVAKTAMELIEEKNIKCDKEKVKIACLLHDIGRVRVLRESDNPEFGNNRHEFHSTEILKKEGLPEIAEIVAKHGYMLINYKPSQLTKGEKILAVADLLTKESGRSTAEERKKYVINKYKSNNDMKTAERFEKTFNVLKKYLKELGVE